MQASTSTAVKPTLWEALGRYFSSVDTLLFWGIVLLAGVLRLTQLNQIEFKLDEVLHLERALRISRGHELLLYGTQASVGITKPPLFTYLIAIPTLFSTDPRFTSGFIALMNVAAVAGFFLLVKRYFGLRCAVIAGILFAVNPWAILNARKIFTADLLMPFTVLLLWGLLRWLVDHRPSGLALAISALAALLAITYSPWPLVLMMAVLLLVNRRQIRWPWLIAGLGIALVLFLPYIYYEISQHFSEYLAFFQRVSSRSTLGAQEASSAPSWIIPLLFAIWLHSGLALSTVAGDAASLFQPGPAWLIVLDYIMAVFFGVGLILVAWRSLFGLLRRLRSEIVARDMIIALWLWLPLLTFWLQPAEIYSQYLVILFPVGFLAIGMAFEQVFKLTDAKRQPAQTWRNISRWAIAGLLLGVVAYQGYSILYLYHFVGENTTSYGVPFGVWQDIAAKTRALAVQQGTDEVWVVADGSEPQYAVEPAVLNYLLAEHITTVFMGQGGQEGLLLPVDRPGVYLLTRSSALIDTTLAQLQAQSVVTVTLPGGKEQARLVIAASRTLTDVLAGVQYNRIDLASDAGPILLAYAWPFPAQPSTSVALATLWSFGDISADARAAQHSAFNQLLYDDGRKAAQDDGFTLAEKYWQPGRVLVQWFELALPADLAAGSYTLITGLYRLDTGVRSNWVNELGESTGDSITLKPLRVGNRE